jgi:hypothetical protein
LFFKNIFFYVLWPAGRAVVVWLHNKTFCQVKSDLKELNKKKILFKRLKKTFFLIVPIDWKD